ncbi:MAG: LytTR family DNA-binding domain-containing protein [Lachnospiraceae bacterium]|nr:LytTR family DNA-binding domain-containing protein [Lachnospiraceae bacterium]
MLRIGICDDSADARDALRVQLEKILNEETEEIVYEFSTGAGAAHWLENHPGEIDLLFLDVEMAGTNGMSAAEAVRRFDTELIIVFVTGYSDYVFDGYKVNALDYIIKPAKSERLLEVLKRVRVQFENRKNDMYVFRNTDGIFRLPIAAIHYFYSDRRKVVLVCGGKEYPFYAKLDEVEQQLLGNFVRIHQRYLVNPRRVVQIGTDYVAVGTDSSFKTLPVSRALKEEAVKKLAKALLAQ